MANRDKVSPIEADIDLNELHKAFDFDYRDYPLEHLGLLVQGGEDLELISRLFELNRFMLM